VIPANLINFGGTIKLKSFTEVKTVYGQYTGQTVPEKIKNCYKSQIFNCFQLSGQ
jgi:hypothetical protein